MPLSFPSPEKDREHEQRPLIPIVIYPNKNMGYGYGRTEAGFNTRSGFALPDGYDRSNNMLSVDGRTLTPTYANESGLSYATFGRTGFAVAWYDNSAVPVPTIIVGHGAVTTTVKNNTNTTDSVTFGTTMAQWTDACLHDNAGTALLYACGVQSLVTGTASMLCRRTNAAVWTQDGDVAAKRIASIAGALWRAKNDYQVSKCPAGSEPFTIGNWGADFQVGTNDAKITSMGGIGPAPVVGKEDGIYLFVEADSRFNPILKINPHPRNFPVMRSDGIGGLFTPTYDGRLVHISQYGAVNVYDPLSGKAPDRDTPREPINDVVAVGGDVYCVMDGNQRFMQGVAGLNLVALKTVNAGGAYTQYLTEGDDKSMATVIDISSLDTRANGDYLLIGFSHPFIAVDFRMVTLNSTSSITVTAAYWDGAQFTDFAGTFDETQGFQSDGRVMFYTGGTDLSSAWATSTIDGLSRYWAQLRVSAAVDSTTTIGEMAVVPFRKGPQFTTTNDNYSEDAETAGGYPRIIRMRGWTTGNVTWDTMYTMAGFTGDRLVASPMPSRQFISASLYAFGQGLQAQYALPQGANPATTNFPILETDSIAYAGIQRVVPPTYYPSAVELGGFYELAYLEVYANNISRGTDNIVAAARMDDTNPWYVTRQESEDHVLFEIPEGMTGTVLHTAFQLLDGAATDPIGPSIRAIVAWVREAEAGLVQAARTTPEVT